MPLGAEMKKPLKSSRSCSTSSRLVTLCTFRNEAAASVSFVSSSSQMSGWLRLGTLSIQSRFGPNWKNAAVFFLFDQRQPQCVAIKGNCLLICVAGTFDRDVRSAGKLRPFEFRNHRLCAERKRLCYSFPPGSVILIGSSARSSSFSGKTFFRRAISRTVRPVFALSFAISAARS
jgi:hypothetical protein